MASAQVLYAQNGDVAANHDGHVNSAQPPTPTAAGSDIQDPLPTDLKAAMQSALANFDGRRVEAIIQAGFDVRRTYLDRHKYRNALHELVLNYVAYSPAERPPKLHHQFIDILSVLLENGLDINDVDFRNQTALHLVAGSNPGGHQDIIRVLLASGARVNQPDGGQQTALHRAVISGMPDDVDALLGGGADPNYVDNMGHSALHVATKRKNNLAILEMLIKRGAKVNLNHPEWTKQNKGATALHTAARFGQINNAEFLLRNKADPNIVDAGGQTALHVAASCEVTGKLCTLLTVYGGRAELRDSLLGETALHKAVRSNAVDNVRVLLAGDRKNLIIIADCFGNTPLHTAAATPATDQGIWNLLFQAGAKTRATNVDRETAFDVANRAKNTFGKAMLKPYE